MLVVKVVSMEARTLAGALLGGVAGALVFGVFIALGLALLARVENGLPIVILAIAGAYAAWLVGVIVFGAVRGTRGQEERTEP
jgi:biotin transporter BioY